MRKLIGKVGAWSWVLCVATPGFAGGGLIWDGGGAQGGNGRVAEYELVARHVYGNLESYIDRGLAASATGSALTPEESGLLTRIRDNLAAERRHHQRLQFATSRRYPEKFVANENAFYTVWTEPRVGSDLWINRDYLENGIGESAADSDGEFAMILLDGLARHLITADDAKVEKLIDDFGNALYPPQN